MNKMYGIYNTSKLEKLQLQNLQIAKIIITHLNNEWTTKEKERKKHLEAN